MKLDVRIFMLLLLIMSCVIGKAVAGVDPGRGAAVDNRFDVGLNRDAGLSEIGGATGQEPADHPDDIYWEEGNGIPGVDGRVNALTEWNGLLVAGGGFAWAGDVPARNVAAWDGAEWSAFGTDLGFDGAIYALTVYHDQLIAGGSFTTAGGVLVNRIAAWNGSSWSPLGSGVNGTVGAVTVYDDQLIAGGTFTTAEGEPANGIAAWNGSSWSALEGGVDGIVNALAVYGDQLIAGGIFTTAGGVSANRIAAWDGSTWSPLGSGVGGTVWALTVGNGVLMASLCFEQDYIGNYIGYVAAWNGSSWSSLGGNAFFAIAVFNGVLYGAGWGTDGMYSYGYIQYRSGTSWHTLSFPDASVIVLAVHDDHLIVGGDFVWAGDVAARHIAAWNGVWSPVGSGIVNPVRALTVFDDQLVACDRVVIFTGAHEKFGRLLSRSGATWSYVGGNWGSYLGDGDVYALAGYGTRPIAGGSFAAFGQNTDYVASWNGSSWSALGSGTDGAVRALAVYDDGLIAGGTFTHAGSGSASRVAAWNGSSWSPLGSGVDNIVYALAVHNDRLIAGGSFGTAGDLPASYIAAWDGSSWSPLGSGVNGSVYALTVYHDQLIAAGAFTMAGDLPATTIAAWNGSSWSALGEGTNGIVRALAVYDEKLIAAGEFTAAGGLPAGRIAAWNDSSWSPLGSGLNGHVQALAVYDNKLFVGGFFTAAGNKMSVYVATWTRRDEVPVFITSFDAVWRQSGVDLLWEIVSDEEVLGFRIYRKAVGGSASEEVALGGLIPPDARAYTDQSVSGGKSYEYTLVVVLADHSEVRSQTMTVRTKAYALELHQNTPNPFNPTTMISFTLPERARVTLAIYDVAGKLVKTLVDDMVGEGLREEVWDGKDANGSPASSGVYFCRLTAGEQTLTKKMVLLK